MRQAEGVNFDWAADARGLFTLGPDWKNSHLFSRAGSSRCTWAKYFGDFQFTSGTACSSAPALSDSIGWNADLVR